MYLCTQKTETQHHTRFEKQAERSGDIKRHNDSFFVEQGWQILLLQAILVHIFVEGYGGKKSFFNFKV
jgi:hypothetical protein